MKNIPERFSSNISYDKMKKGKTFTQGSGARKENLVLG
jgi:hypothetical protein